MAAILPIAFLVGRYGSRLGAVAHSIVLATFALPGLLIALSLRFWTVRSGVAGDLLSDTLALLVFAYVVRFASLAMGITLESVRSVPGNVHDAARTLGANARRRFVNIDLPLMRPGLLAAAGLVLLSTMKELPISLLISPLGFSTLATRIFGSFEDAFIAEAGIMAVILVVLSAVLTWFLVLRRADHL
ncbi:MAG: ABC transporter permease subunit [Actinobacteria bacterium]|nr:ABC transporter permease subunit [Actinomycetota bacterium]